MNIQFIKTTNDLIPSFREALDEICKERKYLAFLEAPPLERVRSFIDELIISGSFQFVAVCDGKVIGWCDVMVNSLPGFNHSGRLGMGVLKEFRGKGIGKKLILATINEAKQTGLRRIELEVFSSNIPAIRLYEKLGFVHEGIKVKARFIDDQFDDIIMMALHL